LFNNNQTTNTYILEASFSNSNVISTSKTVKNFLIGLIDFFNWSKITHINMHKSEKYGWSSWVVLSDNSAIHFYGWDESSPYFISIDLCFMKFIIDEKKIIRYINDQNMIVIDISFREKNNLNNKLKIRSDIFRKRVWYKYAITGSYISLEEFFVRLSDTIKMRTIRQLNFQKNIFWLHWETSGCIGFIKDEMVYFELYSCKHFCENEVRLLIKEYFSINAVSYGVF